jgi:hypothetical protein
MFFLLAEAIAVGQYFGLRSLRLPPRHLLEPWQLLRNQGVLGFSVKQNMQKDHWEIDDVYPDTPASREPRLKEKTTLLKVNGQSAQQMQFGQLTTMLRGPPNSTLEVTVQNGFFFGTKTLLLKRATPMLFDTLQCFGLQFIRRRLGSCALIAILIVRLNSCVNMTRKRGQFLDETILRRVLGGRFIETIARSAKNEMMRMLHARPLCPFIIALQVTATISY